MQHQSFKALLRRFKSYILTLFLASCDEVDIADNDSQKEDNTKEEKQQQAAAQRRKVMAEMAALQKKFLQSNRQVLSEIDTDSNIDE